MSDLDTFKAMLARAGIVFTEPTDEWSPRPGMHTVRIDVDKNNPKNDGYDGFVSMAHFDEQGALESWSTWE